MRRAILLLAVFVAACSKGEGGEGAPNGSGRAVQTDDLTGLYEFAGQGVRRVQMCMIADESGEASFGIVTEAAEGGSCGGAGTAVADGEVLRLTMAGDEQCMIDARISGRQVTFPRQLPPRCDYYCGPGATLAGQAFQKTGGSAADAMRATDLAGDPLCD